MPIVTTPDSRFCGAGSAGLAECLGHRASGHHRHHCGAVLGRAVHVAVHAACRHLDRRSGFRREAFGQRCLDVGGAVTPEAAGFEAILSGARARLPDDDALLANIGAVLDSLYCHYQNGAKA